ncbi:hypothetical protein [uncultured Lacinutrix sp.]|uniref:hypothetical protein n=1 Tax=uncultured Lacinutrix sp. TaxID=574032 RepID=UPI00263608B9|nr:hypothetical protein [uncultured Lacinutrix sp.]
MIEIDKIEEKLVDGGYSYFVSEVIDDIKRKHNIFQYNIAEELKVSSIDISNIKTYSRVKKNDKLIWTIIQKYNVDYQSIIDSINKNIDRRKKEEQKRVKENQFERIAYLYDEIQDIIYTYKFNLNTYEGYSSLESEVKEENYDGRLYGRSINFFNNDGNKIHQPRSYNSSELQIMLNGKNLRKLIKDNYIISGIATQTDNSDDGFAIKTVLITPSDLDKKYEDLIKYFF